ncbi:MAG: amino acid ABC transporter substrate-binding protein [Candidatus Rokubacteria bacterium]|nr:amino acid ABC transporter substrate-binding protein [Candidatus Rokubacteria bacterium]
MWTWTRSRTCAVLAVIAALVFGAWPASAQEPIKIGFGMALTGGLAAGGKSCVIAMQLWADDVNKKGGLLGRKVQLVYYDDQTKGATVPGIYSKLLDVDKVHFVVSGYGTNLIAPAMPIVMERKLVFPALFGLANNEKHNYPGYFQIMPAGPRPALDWTNTFLEVAIRQTPKAQTIAIVGADAEYPHNAIAGMRENVKKAGLKVVYDSFYPPTTVDFTPIARAIKALNPDIVFVASYPPDTAGMVLAAHEVGLRPKLFGGGMVGLQFAALLTKLGPKLNGIVNYDFWVPEPTLKFPGIDEFLKRYQAQAAKEGVDPLGHYLPPWAYSYVQVLGQAIEGTKSLDQQKVAEYIRSKEHDTIVGKVKFGGNGEWAQSRVLQVQFQGIDSGDIAQFHKPGKRVVLWPEKFKSGNIIYPYEKALK